MSETHTILPSPPMAPAEHEFLIGDGSLAGAIAGLKLHLVYCKCGRDFLAAEWREHPRSYPGARYLDDNGPHEAWGFERYPDWHVDYVVFLGEPNGPARS
jgi:hypothetical protein